MRQEGLAHPNAGKVLHFQRNWGAITADQWVLNCVKGYEIAWTTRPTQPIPPRELVFPKQEADGLSTEVQSLLQKQAVSELQEMTGTQCFLSQLFAVPKKDGGVRARGKPEGTELLRGEPILQDGRHSHAERSPTPGRLDDEDRSERCVLRNSGGMPTPEIPCIPLARQNIPIQLPAVRSVVGSVGLYQDHKANSDNSEIPWV